MPMTGRNPKSVTIAKWLTIVGTLLLLPGTFAFANREFSGVDDAVVALDSVLRLSLDSLRSGNTVGLYYQVPLSDQWERIRERANLDGRGYVIFVADAFPGRLIPFTPLGLEIDVLRQNQAVKLDRAEQIPYLFSSSNEGDVGVRFAVVPGDHLFVRVRASHPAALPQGELIVRPYWNSSARDYLQDTALADALIRPLLTKATYAGFMILLAGFVTRSVVALRNRTR